VCNTNPVIDSNLHGQNERGPASSEVEERDNWVYWTVWIRWSDTSDPQGYKALVDTSTQCTLIPSSYKGTEPLCHVKRVKGVWQEAKGEPSR